MKNNAHESSRIKCFFKNLCLISIPADKDPRLLSKTTRSNIITSIAIVLCADGFSSTIYFPGLPYVTKELNALPIVTTLTTSLFFLFMGIAPMVSASISEYYRVRRIIFLFSTILFMVTSIGAAYVKDIWALVAIRCLQSIGVSSGQSVGAGFIADLYPVEERGKVFGKLMFGVVFGPLLGPIIGGFLIMSPLGWRSTFLFCFAFGIFIFCITLLFIPETFRDNKKFEEHLPVSSGNTIELLNDTSDDINQSESPQLKTEQLENDQQSTVNNDFVDEASQQKKSFNPFSSFALLRHPFVWMSSIIIGVFFGSLFATETILPEAFSKTYGLNSWQVGLSYLGAGTGNMIGSFTGGQLSDRLLLRSRRLRGGKAKVEDRLTANIWLAGFIFNPLGLLIFGWVIEYKLSFWGAIVGFGIQCFGNIQVTTSLLAYVVDAVPGRSASVSAASTFILFLFGCLLTIISTPMIENLGPGWTSTLFASLSWFGMLIAFTLKVRGERLRHWSGY